MANGTGVGDGVVIKPGWKTSEFWLSLGCVVLSAVWGSGLIPLASPLDKGIAVVAVAASALGYSISRGLAKRQ